MCQAVIAQQCTQQECTLKQHCLWMVIKRRTGILCIRADCY
jgi:hypothetical protein